MFKILLLVALTSSSFHDVAGDRDMTADMRHSKAGGGETFDMERSGETDSSDMAGSERDVDGDQDPEVDAAETDAGQKDPPDSEAEAVVDNADDQNGQNGAGQLAEQEQDDSDHDDVVPEAGHKKPTDPADVDADSQAQPNGKFMDMNMQWEGKNPYEESALDDNTGDVPKKFYANVKKVVNHLHSAVDRAGRSVGTTGLEAHSLLEYSKTYNQALGALSKGLKSFNVGVKSFREHNAKKHQDLTAKLQEKIDRGLTAGIQEFEKAQESGGEGGDDPNDGDNAISGDQPVDDAEAAVTTAEEGTN